MKNLQFNLSALTPYFLAFFLLSFNPVKSQSLPNADFTFTINSNGNVAFTSTSTNTTGLVHKWYFGDGSSTFSVQSTAHTYTSTGYYAALLVLESANGATRDSTTKSVHISSIVTSVNELMESNTLMFYPNPAKEVLYIKNLPGYHLKLLTVTDISSKIVFCEKINSMNENPHVTLSAFSPGIYLLKLELDGGDIITHKIVVQQ